MRLPTKTSIVLTAMLAAVALGGCTAQPSPADDSTITIVASTNVYGDIASAIGGDLVEVTSMIDDPSQDPHSFEADARVQLALSKADIVIENGGGYDAFIDQLLSSLNVPQQVVISAVESSPLELDEGESHDDEHAEDDHAGHDHGGFNEHVWYHFPTIAAVAGDLRDALISADPKNSGQYEANTTTLLGELDALEQRASAIHSVHEGTGVAITEPAPLYLLEQAGLHNLTPASFSEAIEEGSEVSAAVLNEVLTLFQADEVHMLFYNDQTTSPETEALLVEADKAGVPVVPVTELMPQGSSYTDWMNGVLDEIETALGAP